MKKTTVSMGIPAYNEEANIEKLIKSLLNQKQISFILKEIIVVSDQSSDKTDEIVRRFKHNKVKLFRNKERSGQAISQNKIKKHSSSQITIFLNADVLPKNDSFIEELIKPFSIDKKVGMVGGKPVPVPGKTYFEKVVNYSSKMKQELYESINKNNLYLCHGRVRAFSKKFLKNFKWEPTFGEDAFSYLSCIFSGYTFIYQPSAEVYYRSPQTLKEHLKQSTRFLQSNKNLQTFFDKELIQKAYFIPQISAVKISIKYILKNPIYFCSYALILIYSKIQSITGEKASYKWNISTTSKKL